MGMHKVKGKTQSVLKMLQRVERDTNFARLAAKVDSWMKNEPENSEIAPKLKTLQDIFSLLAKEQANALNVIKNLQDAKYVPPKPPVKINLEHGRHVWIKPKYVDQFRQVMSADALQNLFVDVVTGGKVVVAIGNPDSEAVTIKHLIPKIVLQVSEGEIEAVAA